VRELRRHQALRGLPFQVARLAHAHQLHVALDMAHRARDRILVSPLDLLAMLARAGGPQRRDVLWRAERHVDARHLRAVATGRPDLASFVRGLAVHQCHELVALHRTIG
jgi:hypothetical protein